MDGSGGASLEFDRIIRVTLGGATSVNNRGRQLVCLDGRVVVVKDARLVIDPFPGEYPPKDTGSSVTAAANAQRQLGRIREFRWGFGGRDALAMLKDGPVIVGTVWKRSMFNPDANGYMRVYGADDDLGHSYVWINYSARCRRIKILNSWGPTWAHRGFAYLHEEDALGLIDNNGEAVRYIV